VSHASITFIVLAVVVVLFVWNVVPVELVAVGQRSRCTRPV
jgi:hypothetical protein